MTTLDLEAILAANERARAALAREREQFASTVQRVISEFDELYAFWGTLPDLEGIDRFAHYPVSGIDDAK